ncbi:hypothetical protein COV93_08585 [Candidatus Woesearchaeota archaeon CG11_big_fil_rev_8_21_14_0_20_43_8]|nr:MAG: hypothetical protein COV93_08585 [Candidatus Woesearchaeota archaeon CG11_big_fil_rev_8_21_14_0_20_43_8]PIO04824.1 MAG: hypothetical protein COT47_07380 [Candidatus Woesearchaeota archaeon CG08_land_8_20_14_0_20_43_7]
MARIPVNIVKSKGKPKEKKSPEELLDERLEVFKRSGCTQQFPECPEIPDWENPECKDCPHYPKKFKN